VAWSLEIETQFYLSFPVIFLVLGIKNVLVRRLTLFAAILIFSLISYAYPLDRRTLLQFLQYFLIGMLFYDFYLTGIRWASFGRWVDWGLFFVVLVIVGNSGWQDSVSGHLLSPWLIALLFWIVFGNSNVSKGLSHPSVTLVGGMCYSIYLMHYPLLSLFGRCFKPLWVDSMPLLSFIMAVVLLITATVGITSIFFILVERPTMIPNWPEKVSNLIKRNRVKNHKLVDVSTP
jgi:peptidoglycan/LPS O-acetylase OafA/YrhL